MRRLAIRTAAGLVCLLAAAAPGTEFVRPAGRGFELNNQPFRFVGFNVRGACHYGAGDVLPAAGWRDLQAALDFCQQTRARVIRVFCAYRGITPGQTGDRLAAVLDECAARDLYVLVALTDVYRDTLMHPAGDTPAYTYEGCCGLWLLGHAWYQSGYQTYYKPQVLYLVNRFRDHPAVFAWQLGNEIRDIGYGSTFLAFCQDMAAAIRAVDPNHMISIGLIGAWHAQTDALQLYQPFDFVSSHNYNGGGDNDTWIAVQLNKPYVVDEAGFDSAVFGPDRTPESGADMTLWFDQRGAAGYMNWALMAANRDIGDGDHMFGIDRVLGTHGQDYDAYRSLYALWGNQFVSPSTLAVAPAQIEREARIGQPVAPASISVSGTGLTPFAFRAIPSAAWVSVTPSEGYADGNPVSLQVSFDPAGLPEGTHTATVRIQAPFISNSPVDVSISLELYGRKGDMDDDEDIDQADFGAFQACLSGMGLPAGAGCQVADYNSDGDVDAADTDRLRSCMTAPGVPAVPECLR